MSSIKSARKGSASKSKGTEERREKLLEKISPTARQHIQNVTDWFARSDRSTLEERHRLGLEIKALYEDKEKNSTGHYGIRFVASLSEVFGWDKGTVYGALTLAKTYTVEEVAELCDRPMDNGRLISYTHLRSLAKVKIRKTREALLNKAIAKCWTRQELEDAILEATTGSKTEDGRGRPLKPPKDLRGLLRQQERAAQDFVRRANEVWEEKNFSLLKQAKNLPDKEVSEEQVEKLKQHAAMLRELQEKADEQAEEAERAAEYLQKKMLAREGGQNSTRRSAGDNAVNSDGGDQSHGGSISPGSP